MITNVILIITNIICPAEVFEVQKGGESRPLMAFPSTSSWSRSTWGYLGRGGCWWRWPAGSSRSARAATWQRTLPGCPGYWSCFRCCPGYRSSWRCCPGAWGSWCFDNFVVPDIDHVLHVVLEQEARDVLTTLLSWRKIMFLMLSWSQDGWNVALSSIEVFHCDRFWGQCSDLRFVKKFTRPKTSG